MNKASESREELLLELIRAMLSLTGRAVEVRMQIPGGRLVLELEGVLTTPFRQPLDSEVITLGFHLDAQRLDLHLDDIADLQRWSAGSQGATPSAAGLRLLFEDGASLEIRERTSAGETP